MAEHVSTIIIGASCYGCGIAARRSDSLILESTIQPGAEFTLTGCPARNLETEPEFPEARAFQKELIQRKVIENGMLHNAALAPVLAKWCLNQNLKIRLNAPVVRRTVSLVSVMEVCGPREYSADEIIDARPAPGNEKYLYSFLSRSICQNSAAALLASKTTFAEALSGFSTESKSAQDYRQTSFPNPSQNRSADFCQAGLSQGDTGAFGDFEVLQSVSSEYLLLRQKLPLSADYREARKCLLEFWRKRPAELRESMLLWSSSRFSFDIEDNPVSALDRGLKRGAK